MKLYLIANNVIANLDPTNQSIEDVKNLIRENQEKVIRIEESLQKDIQDLKASTSDINKLIQSDPVDYAKLYDIIRRNQLVVDTPDQSDRIFDMNDKVNNTKQLIKFIDTILKNGNQNNITTCSTSKGNKEISTFTLDKVLRMNKKNGKIYADWVTGTVFGESYILRYIQNENQPAPKGFDDVFKAFFPKAVQQAVEEEEFKDEDPFEVEKEKLKQYYKTLYEIMNGLLTI